MKVIIRRLGDGPHFVREELDMSRFMGVEFDLGEGRTFVVDDRNDLLDVRTTGDRGQLVILPGASNNVSVDAKQY